MYLGLLKEKKIIKNFVSANVNDFICSKVINNESMKVGSMFYMCTNMKIIFSFSKRYKLKTRDWRMKTGHWLEWSANCLNEGWAQRSPGPCCSSSRSHLHSFPKNYNSLYITFGNLDCDMTSKRWKRCVFLTKSLQDTGDSYILVFETHGDVIKIYKLLWLGLYRDKNVTKTVPTIVIIFLQYGSQYLSMKWII